MTFLGLTTSWKLAGNTRRVSTSISAPLLSRCPFNSVSLTTNNGGNNPRVMKARRGRRRNARLFDRTACVSQFNLHAISTAVKTVVKMISAAALVRDAGRILAPVNVVNFRGQCLGSPAPTHDGVLHVSAMRLYCITTMWRYFYKKNSLNFFDRANCGLRRSIKMIPTSLELHVCSSRSSLLHTLLSVSDFVVIQFLLNVFA